MLGNMVIFANSILVNSIIVLIIKAKVSKSPCEGRLAFLFIVGIIFSHLFFIFAPSKKKSYEE